MWGTKCGRVALAAALVIGVVACSEEPAPLELRGAAGVAEAPANPINARQLDAPVWEAILSPLNSHVGAGAVTGKAVMTMDGDGNLTVRLDVKGVVAGQLHPQHIHGHVDRVASCPNPQADADGDGEISVDEGLPDYGPVIVSLQPFQTPATSRYTFEATYPGQADLAPETRAVVVHGAFVDGVYIASLPVACGKVKRVR